MDKANGQKTIKIKKEYKKKAGEHFHAMDFYAEMFSGFLIIAVDKNFPLFFLPENRSEN
jgi:hypothetical protein